MTPRRAVLAVLAVLGAALGPLMSAACGGGKSAAAGPDEAKSRGAATARAAPGRFTPSLPTCGGRCGSERWAVKTLSDRYRGQVRLDSIVPTTIEQLVALPPPEWPFYRRLAPVETTVYRVEARLVYWASEPDHDFHLLLASPRDRSVTMIAEIPDPECDGACRSGYAERFARMRQEVVERFEASGVAPGRERFAPRVTVTGVGFFDREHGQTGAAPNQIELHPVLDLRFR